MRFDDLLFMFYLALISFVAGVIGLINRAEHTNKESLKQKIIFLCFGGVSSIFIGFVTFEISFYFLANQRLCVAITALASWMGTRLLLQVQNRALDFIDNFKRD